MSELSFANVFGEPVSTAPVKQARAIKPRATGHMGWFVYGISPQSVAKARALSSNFNLNSFLRTAKPEKVNSKAYTIPGSASEAGQLAVRSGWHGVHIREKVVQ